MNRPSGIRPLQGAEDVKVLEYGLGSSIQVRIALTPTPAKSVEPVDVAPWDFDVGALADLPVAG